MKKYLLDTNICAYFLNGKYNLETKIDEVGFENCFVSEITIAELKYGVAKAHKKRRIEKLLKPFKQNLTFFLFSLHLTFTQQKKPD